MIFDNKWAVGTAGYSSQRTTEASAAPTKTADPLLDRIDLHVEVPALRYAELAAAPPAEGTAAVRERVGAARRRQRERLAGLVQRA